MQKIINIAVLCTAALAQDDGPDPRKYSHIVKMVRTQIAGKTAWSDKEISKRIQNYGCHCFPGMTRIAGGQGPPQDNQDDLCRTLARCHKCIEHDHGVSAFNSEWDDNIGKYRWELTASNSIDCSGNKDQFKTDLCTCDSAFAMALGSDWDDNNFNYAIWDNKHNSLYNFDMENVCQKIPGDGMDSCCGNYPERYPYSSATRNCCASSGKTYNTLSEECCNDGTIASLGSC
jgi:hypothetical protein